MVELDMDKGYITWDYRMFPLIHRYIYCVIIDQSKNIKILKKKKNGWRLFLDIICIDIVLKLK